MRAATPRSTLSALLRRGHLRVVMVTMLLFGIFLVLIGHAVLGAAQARHLDLVARTVGYSVEAAVTFRDAEAAREVLRDIAQRERLSEVEIVLPDGQLLADFRPPVRGELDALVRRVGGWLIRDAASAPIVPASGQRIAEVRLRSDGLDLVWMLLYGAAAGGLCLLVALFAATMMTRSLERSLVEPINRLAALTRTIRSERAYDRRAPPAWIAELQALGDDFNAMLDEVQAREAELVAHQRRLLTDNERLAHRAGHDPLTGLANRTQFEQRLHEALAMVGRRGGHVGVLYLDADGFKAVNDSAGHAAGDKLLVQMADRLCLAVRDTDVVARLGGDEFAVLLLPLGDSEDARRVGRQIQRQMVPPFDLGEHGVFRCGLSIGMAIYPHDGDTMPALLDTADRAMYRAKKETKRARRP
ncbi:MAG: diguanylate cyclase [Leptothrix sp. (in: b-proteobacteria)]